ncbi:MAG: 1-deoxy-D-xylulose-5-phosphate reductoisomerase [bacterium]|nr:1-deoxy-D-xylulose-5-phosphate reductoisomerase [bacterium]
MVRKLILIGSTGALGTQVLEVIREFRDRFEIVGLGARRDSERLALQVNEFHPKYVLLTEEDSMTFSLKSAIESNNSKFFFGIEGLKEIVSVDNVDLVVIVMGGALGIYPLWEAIRYNRNVAIANKESIVMMGEIIRELANEKGVNLIPIDSEPSAIFQCLQALNDREELDSVILTASGGPFRRFTKEQLERVTPEEAIAHPVWRMGRRISVDSATLMNKGLEYIELHKFFNIPYEKIHIVVHPQGIMHGAISLIDGTFISLMSNPDMRIPIFYALSYPERLATPWKKLSLLEIKELTFEPPDVDRFPALRIAMEAGRKGASYPTVLNASDETAVELFLNRRIKFTDIPILVEEVLCRHNPISIDSVDTVMEIDSWARRETINILDRVIKR